MAAGYYRGWVDPVLMRFTDLVLTIPGIAILIVMAGRVRGTRGNWWAIALIVAVLSWPGTARMVRAMVLSLREKEFVEAARAIGASTGRIMVHHLLPHAAGPIIVRATFAVGGAIFAETGLSYLGLGISPPDTSLGSLVGTGQSRSHHPPLAVLLPGAVHRAHRAQREPGRRRASGRPRPPWRTASTPVVVETLRHAIIRPTPTVPSRPRWVVPPRTICRWHCVER